MGREIEVRVASVPWPEASDLAGEWDALAGDLSTSPFIRPGWFSAWYEAFAAGRQLLLVARRNERLVGVLPLVSHRGFIASATNGHTPYYAPIVADDRVLEALIAAALERTKRRLDLGFLADDIALQVLARHGESDGLRSLKRVCDRSPYVALAGTWETYESSLPSKRRSDMRRRWRRLEATGSIELDDATDADRIGDLLEEGWAVEASSWKGKAGTAIAAQPATLLFYERIADWAIGTGILRLFFLRIDRRAIAFAFCLADSRSLNVLKIGVDPAYAKFAPGVLLTRHMLSQAFATGFETYEFLGAADPYKLVWTDRTWDRVRIQIFPGTPIGIAEALAWQRGRPLAKRLIRRRSRAVARPWAKA